MKDKILFALFLVAISFAKVSATNYTDTTVNGAKYYKIVATDVSPFNNDTAQWLQVRNVYTDPTWRSATVYYELSDSDFRVVYKLTEGNPVLTDWDSIKNNPHYPFQYIANLLGLTLITTE